LPLEESGRATGMRKTFYSVRGLDLVYREGAAEIAFLKTAPSFQPSLTGAFLGQARLERAQGYSGNPGSEPFGDPQGA
jgi:hypothetical protein